MASAVVGVMAKFPESGRVMTRLGETVGMKRAARFYAGCLGWITERLSRSPFRVVLFYSPDDTEGRFRRLLGVGSDFPMVAQSGSDLGERMHRALVYLHESYREPSMLIGSDAPDLPLQYLQRGADRLGDVDLVLGPARDGGYYLVGTDQPRASLFEGMTWSRSDVLERTLRRACREGLRVMLTPMWRDLDTLEDLMNPPEPPRE